MTDRKNITYYLSLPYTTVLRRDEEGDVVARIEELPGCISHGSSESEAITNLAKLKQLWLQDALQNGEWIPEPQDCDPLPSGKWVQRVPKSLHQKLTKLAKQEGVSLNQLVTQVLAERCGARKVEKAVEDLLAGCVVPSAWGLEGRHYWDASVLKVNGQLTGSPATHLVFPNLERLMPQSIKLKVEHAGESNETNPSQRW